MNLFAKEPAVLVGIVQAALALAVAFGLDLTGEQVGAITAFAAACLALLVRQAVVSPATLADKIGEIPARAVGGLAGRLVGVTDKGDRGSIPLALLILVGLAVIIGAGFAVCGDALFEDEDETDDLGLPALVLDHDGYGDCDPEWGDCGYEQDYDQWNNEDRNRNRNRNRGAFSPGPFDDSPVDAFNGNTICLPGSTCYSDEQGDRSNPE